MYCRDCMRFPGGGLAVRELISLLIIIRKKREKDDLLPLFFKNVDIFNLGCYLNISAVRSKLTVVP